MTELAIIYYHKPRVRRTNLRKELLEGTELDFTKSNSKNGISRFSDIPEFEECKVPKDSILSYSANTLRSLGLIGKYDGFSYICRAIEEILKYKEPPHFQSIYYDIGKEFGVNRTSVERSIRYSIGYIKRTGNKHNLSAIIGDAMDDDKNFSNSKFLTILAADVYEKLKSLEVEK